MISNLEIEIPQAINQNLILNPIREKFPDFLNEDFFINDLAVICDFREPVKPFQLLGLSFIITDLQSLEPYRQLRLQVKEKYSKEGQEIKYSKWGSEEKRPKYVNELINVADEIKGLMCNIIIHPSLDFFISNYYSRFTDKFTSYKKIKLKVFRKLDFISHFIACLVNPFLRRDSLIHLVSDKDNIFANEEIRKLSLNYILRCIKTYNKNENINLGYVEPDKDSDDRYLVDLCSIPDLAVGCLTDLVNSFDGDYSAFRNGRHLFNNKTKRKALSYSEWLFVNNKPLKRINFFVELDTSKDMILVYPMLPVNK